jgi:RNA-directed DNA polymerase
MLFEICDKAQLARLLAVAPQEIDHVLGRIDRFYRPIKLAKRDGGCRNLLVPCGKLRLLQDKVKSHILDQFVWLDCVHGGIKGRSVLSNALPHVQKQVVFTLDIKDFFPHVTPDRVFRIFCGLGFGEEPAGILTKATTWKYQLPQGAPTSTGLANLSLVRADWRILRLAEKHKFSYTRYVDDLSLSGDWRLLGFRKLIERIIRSEGFQIKAHKSQTMHCGVRQTVTRLVVNNHVNMPREWREAVRREVLKHIHGEVVEITAESLRGRVNWLSYLNRNAGGKLIRRMQAAKAS